MNIINILTVELKIVPQSGLEKNVLFIDFTVESLVNQTFFFIFIKTLILFVSTFKIFIKIAIKRIRGSVISPHSYLARFFCFTCNLVLIFSFWLMHTRK